MTIFNQNLIGVKESVTDEFLLLNHYFIPLISIVGIGREIGSTQHTWFEDEMFAKSDVIANGGDVLVGDTTFEVADGSKFRVGHVVSVEGSEELMLITEIDEDELTVVRGYQGTTAEAFDDDIPIFVQWIDGEEGADARVARYKPRKVVSNLTQIFDDSIEISGTAEAVIQHGVGSEYEKEKQKKLQEKAWELENALINGVKHDAAKKTRMQGIRKFIETNVTDASNEFMTMDMINALVQDVVDSGGLRSGGNYAFVMPSMQKAVARELFGDDLIVPHTDRVRGTTVDAFITDNGMFRIDVNDNLRKNELMFVDYSRMEVRPLRTRGWFHTYMGKTGDKLLGQLVGEYTLEFHQEKAHARAFNLKTK